ncbi:MogA/MoaB family molybdenum cofactor biosynthesis protein [Lederbergia galactosidilytica]|uniref:Molybdenum cofactor biosynthesis protein B n=1 Tax=Lederbergia galactosidilytica TaxID=217031 RepID=A0A177ZK83_9BACI|nr:molybdenum cofactor biosynthesis protein B [Lederbergia galactosidilytica]KRG14543.1 molybdenum cofactor biosynthesis protein B [Virgibacillus soli]MBP1915383.1 molybdenum cofactor biosynthesis protein B [Lederbergia galactosidilytica]OAK68194.1 molybdenum cofactor biosynthesis protein B [Lederbergia galactosidilytica]
MSVADHLSNRSMSIACSVITVSDTRTNLTDKSGNLVKELLMKAGHQIAFYNIVKDEPSEIMTSLNEAAKKATDVILITGGTGIAKRDVTIETISPLYEKEIIGFGELFRMLSYTEDIGSAAMMSRASAGVYKNKAVFIMPGSTGAVSLAMNKLILKELVHVVKELNK